MALLLVVDDTEAERTRVSGLLEHDTEHRVVTAVSGEDALAILEQETIDLVVTDLRMPGMSGIDLIEEVQDRYPGMPVLLLTGYGSEEETVRAIRAGAAGYLNKASAARELLPLVNRLLAARSVDLAHAAVMKRREVDEYELRLPSQRKLMSAAAAFLRQRVQASDIWPEKEVLRLGIALEEALLNACLHGNLELESVLREENGDHFEALADERSSLSPWKDRHVHVRASITPECVRIVVRDEGEGFDPSELPDPTDPENLLKPHGRGVMIMKMFLDEVVWNETGNEVTLIKRAGCSGETASDDLDTDGNVNSG